MAITFIDEYKKALDERGSALVSKRTAIQMKAEAEKRRDDLEEILFGDTINYGIVSILSFLYDQIWIMTGEATSKPLLHDFSLAKSQYQDNFYLSISTPGDGPDGLHPPMPDNPDAGQDDVDINSAWLTDHALQAPTGTGVIPLLNSLSEVIGVVASNAGNNRGPYPAVIVPESPPFNIQAQVNADRGSGILGARTENSEVTSTGTEPSIQYFIGIGGVDTPDNFSQKANLISALENVKNKLNLLITAFEKEISLLEGENGLIFQEFRVDLPNDPNLANLIIQVQQFISQIQNYIDYFSQFNDPSPSSNRTEINSKLSEVLSYSTTITSFLNDRKMAIISGLLGDASSGVNKHLTFWISEIVAKPDGPYAMLYAANDIFEQAQLSLDKKNSRLSFFNLNHNEWIKQPEIQNIYDRIVMNLDQTTVNRIETDIFWNMIMPANKYKIISKPLNQITFPVSNALWDESLSKWIVDITASSFLNNSITIEPPSETTFFRVIAYDTQEGDLGDFDRMEEGFNTSSIQSDIISDLIDFIQLPNSEMGQSVIEVIGSFGLKERNFLMINDSEISQIVSTLDNKYALDRDYGEINKIQQLFGLYFKEEE